MKRILWMKRMSKASRRPWLSFCLGLTCLLSMVTAPGTAGAAEAGDEATPLEPPRPRPDAAELRQRARLLSPEERQKLMRESLSRRGVTNWAEWQKRREEFRNLTPEQRQARMREQQQRPESSVPGFRVLTPAERESKRQELRQRVDGQIKLLRDKQSEGALSDVEARRLERMVEMSKGLEKGTVLGRRPVPGGVSGEGKPTDVLPPPAVSPEPAKPAPGPGR